MDRRWMVCCFVCGVLTLAAGCNGQNQEVTSTGTSHVRLLTMLYNRVASELGRPPKDEAEFKAKIAAADTSLEKLGVTNTDDLFVSERDGQPLVVAYGGPPTGSNVVVYEQTGENGLRFVGHRIGMVEEVDQAKFEELVPKSATP